MGNVEQYRLKNSDGSAYTNTYTLINDAAGHVLLRDQAGNVQRHLIVS